MTQTNAAEGPVPKWFFECLEASQRAEGCVRTVRLELRHLLRSTALDAETRTRLEENLAALDRASGRLTILQASARNALDEILNQKTG
jgi:hypothetical protein